MTVAEKGRGGGTGWEGEGGGEGKQTYTINHPNIIRIKQEIQNKTRNFIRYINVIDVITKLLLKTKFKHKTKYILYYTKPLTHISL